LGAIIEKITKQTFYDYVQKNIFDRAGMTSTGYFQYGTKKVATPMTRNETSTGWKEGKHGMRGSSAGGAYSTLADIDRFSRALRDNTLIRRETLQLMTTAKNNLLDSSESYGYGFILRRSGGESGYGHGGTTDGVNFEFDYFPEQDVTLILFCNQNNGAYDDLKKNMIKLITGDR
jgi:CubicO group peptidase (beta-lactamase class C family)